ncbi:efflux RND transporter periplasmic adaptor subunit [Desulforamulus aeronauticus]|uniref:RND family efflux transporter, MFP subunit n=1 Tax=Desulforamulus aeronauticus DSM 10349 TaxID=1121421 RepID=A0A1M6WIK4_9FIRM|nr:efflux RND transporter periplasmic adaptor subunit [Desulforamulus aeronauticus]SHK93613.1 RND family efflux transporter, MFP subunit [Desulforamulus aeronauticus DSM 10349]
MKRLVFLVSLMVLLTASLTGCGEKEQKAVEEKLVPVETIKIKATDLTQIMNSTGEVIAGVDVAVVPKAAGKVASVAVKMGDRVNPGQVLLSLDAADVLEQAEAALEQAEARLVISQRSLIDAEIAYERNKTLYDAQAIPKAQFEQVESALINAQANVRLAEAQVKQSRSTVTSTRDNNTLTSPVSGIVAAVTIEPGEMVSSQAAPITIVQIDTVKVKVNVSENIIDSIKTGSDTPVTINALKKDFVGKVISIAPKADSATRAFAVEISIANPTGEIKPGMVARLNLTTGTSSAVLALPIDAVLERDGQHSVFIVEDGKAKEVSVKVGATSGELMEIRAGLKEGQTVIVTGNRLVGEGQKVKVVKELGGAAK